MTDSLEVFQSDAAWTVYQCLSAHGTVLYVGVTSRGSGRLADHVVKVWWVAVETIYVSHFETEREARDAEARCIRDLRPLFNVNARPPGPPALLCTNRDLQTTVEELEDRVASLTAELDALKPVPSLTVVGEANAA